VPHNELLVTQTLSRELEDYRVATPLARAALQMQNAGKTLRMGQKVQFIYTLGEPGVLAWDLPETPDPRTIDIPRYKELFFRAAFEALQPLGKSQEFLKNLLLGQAGYPAPSGGSRILGLPLFAGLAHIRIDQL
jgi:DNA polymerase elongation subunit (family B)